MTDVFVGRGPDEPPFVIPNNGAKSTFKLEADQIEATMLAPIAPVLEDLLDIACAVFATDGEVKRGGLTRPDMGDDWRRTFDFEVSVRCPDVWARPDVTGALTEVVSFLTDDNISFRFRAGVNFRPSQSFLNLDPEGAVFAADEVILFSGGLDSFSGALEALETRSGRVLLVTHRSAPKAIPRQVRLGKYLAKRFPGRVLHIHVLATRIGTTSTESTQRSRSFLFAALGQVLARMSGARQVSIYENGVVSHNLPISPQIIGTMATRTTHPLALKLLGELMDQIDPRAVPIKNPFAWLTKTEVVQRIADHNGSSMIRDSVSCTSVRDQTKLHTHCGACSQCLDRRFAILANGLEAQDPEEMYHTAILTGPRETDRSRTLAVDWTRHALALVSIDMKGYLTRFGQELMRVIQGHPELPQSDALANSLELHARHAAAVMKALASAYALQASALARAELPATCLLRLHGGAPPGHASTHIPMPDPPMKPVEFGGAKLEAQSDLVLDASRPIEVSFLHEKAVPMVVVHGIGRYLGANAIVAHAMKPTFDEDRAQGLKREEHRYIASGTLASQFETSKSVVEQRVKRLRSSIARDYEIVMGRPPTNPLLIETLKPRGYRLDPDLRIIKD